MAVLWAVAQMAWAATGASTYATDGIPDMALIAKIEASLKMPETAIGLGQYVRLYARTDRDTVSGVFIHHKIASSSLLRRQPKAYIVIPGEFPTIYGGGCFVMHVEYRISTKKLSAPICGSRE
jgi:hypothetical protein